MPFKTDPKDKESKNQSFPEHRKVRINFSQKAISIIESDQRIFGIREKSTFISIVFYAFKDDAKSSVNRYIERRKKILKEELEKKIKEKEESGKLEELTKLDNYTCEKLLEYLAETEKQELESEKDRYKSMKSEGDGKIYHLSKEISDYLLKECNEDGIYDQHISHYIKCVLEEYCELPFIKRERYVKSNEYRLIESACDPQKRCQIKLMFNQNEDELEYIVRPYKIVPDFMETEDYLICKARRYDMQQQPMRLLSFSMRNINSPRIRHRETFSFSSKEEKEMDDILKRTSAAYLTDTHEIIRVKLTNKGKCMYQNMLYMRPEVQKDDSLPDNEYRFSCSESQIFNYFINFGKEAEILEPKILRHKFIQTYDEAMTAYIGTEKTASRKDYIDYACKAINKMYNITNRKDGDFVSYKGQIFPDTCIFPSYDARKITFYDHTVRFGLKCDFKDNEYNRFPKLLNKTDYENRKKHYQNQIDQIPLDVKEYMCNTIKTDEDSEITAIDFFVGSYSDNMVSTLALRDEFEERFRETKGNIKNFGQTPTHREKLHNIIGSDYSIEKLFSGVGRYNQMGLQLIVLFKNPNSDNRDYVRYTDDKHYWTFISRRKESVYEQGGFYQFAPCGALYKFENECNNSALKIMSNIMYLIASRLFNCRISNNPSSKTISSNMLNEDLTIDNEYCQEILDLLKNNKSYIEWIGLSSAYLALKSDMVFLLTIEDETWYEKHKNRISASNGKKYIDVVPIDYIRSEKYIDDPCLAEEIAPCLALLEESTHAENIFEKRQK